MISSVRRCTLGGIISGLNGDAFVALVPESVNFDRRRGGEVATKYHGGPALIMMSRGHNHVPHGCSMLVVGHQATIPKTMVVQVAPHTSAVEGWYLYSFCAVGQAVTRQAGRQLDTV